MGSGVVALLGSGETAPGMTKIHRELLGHLSDVRAVNLDTAYGFQLNVPQMTEKLVEYFSTSLLTTLDTLSLTSFADASPVQRTIFKQGVRDASYVFAGPGSPSYALAQWRPLELRDDLADVLANDGVLCFASAAALTLGAFTAPIYEIYKVGVPEPYWLEGLDVMAHLGLRCAVIPHFDNREGSNYDTRYCYLGEPRLIALEAQLPVGTGILGVDEHTAVLLDLAADTLSVRGRGGAYWRVAGETRSLKSTAPVPLTELRNASASVAPQAPQNPVSLASDELEDLASKAISGGSGALDAVARLVHRASQGVAGRIDPTDLINAILVVRANARLSRQFELADQLRKALVDAGVDVNDSPDGSTWSLH